MSLGRSAKYSLYRFGGVLPLAGQQEVEGAAGPLARPSPPDPSTSVL